MLVSADTKSQCMCSDDALSLDHLQTFVKHGQSDANVLVKFDQSCNESTATQA